MDIGTIGEQYHSTKNLIYLDWNNNGPDYLDQFFDEAKVMLSEVFTRDGSGIDAGEIPFYEGWDYLVVSFGGDQLDEVKCFVAELGIPGDKVIYVSDDSVLLGDPESTSILSPFWKLVIERNTKLKEYQQKAMGNYVAVSAEGMSFINTSRDECINYSMYVQKEVWAKDDMLTFYNMAQERFSFREEQNVFCDIGANIGTTSLYFKKNIDSKIKILAFEPSKENYKLYRINAIINDIDDDEVQLEKCGLSDSEYECEFTYDPINPGGSSITTEESWGQKDIVKMISFDEYVERRKLDVNSIKYIWVDVEGHEPDFIKGAKQTLKAINVPIIMEFTPRLYKGRYKEYVEDLAEIYDSFSLAAGDWKKEYSIRSLLELEDIEEQLDLFLFKK